MTSTSMLVVGGPIPYVIIDGMKCYGQTTPIPEWITYFVIGLVAVATVLLIYFIHREWR